MCLTAKNIGLQEENTTSPNRRERPLIRKTGWSTTESERKREREDAASALRKRRIKA